MDNAFFILFQLVIPVDFPIKRSYKLIAHGFSDFARHIPDHVLPVRRLPLVNVAGGVAVVHAQKRIDHHCARGHLVRNSKMYCHVSPP